MLRMWHAVVTASAQKLATSQAIVEAGKACMARLTAALFRSGDVFAMAANVAGLMPEPAAPQTWL
jgi:hypothetical protein